MTGHRRPLQLFLCFFAAFFSAFVLTVSVTYGQEGERSLKYESLEEKKKKKSENFVVVVVVVLFERLLCWIH